jgi:hypothetical protein
MLNAARFAKTRRDELAAVAIRIDPGRIAAAYTNNSARALSLSFCLLKASL